MDFVSFFLSPQAGRDVCEVYSLFWSYMLITGREKVFLPVLFSTWRGGYVGVCATVSAGLEVASAVIFRAGA